MQEIIKDLQALFDGLDRAHGEWTGTARTYKTPPTEHLWKSHLLGKIGLGIIPIKDNATCKFGAIDVDDDKTKHIELAKRIAKLNIPVVVCRSKSGGAHLYYFCDPPITATEMIKRLSTWAGKLGYGDQEIFPKQTAITPNQIGNWINLPYFSFFGNVSCNRKAFNENGELTLEQFIELAQGIQQIKISTESEKAEGFDNAPPCLIQLKLQGVPKGLRNETIYNFGVYLRRSDPENWIDRLYQLNYEIFHPALAQKEIQTVVRSIDKKDYNYKCAPILAFCNRTQCIGAKYGIKRDYYEELTIGQLTKISTEPPRWTLEINGIELTVSTEEVMDYRRMRIACLERIDVIAPPMKNEDWLQVFKAKIPTMKTEKAPEDTGPVGQIKPVLVEFLQLSDRATGRIELLRGVPVKDVIDGNQVVLFRSSDFIGFLKRKKMFELQGPNLWLALRNIGCGHTKIRIGENITQIWYAPMDMIDNSKIPPKREEPEI